VGGVLGEGVKRYALTIPRWLFTLSKQRSGPGNHTTHGDVTVTFRGFRQVTTKLTAVLRSLISVGPVCVRFPISQYAGSLLAWHQDRIFYDP